MRRFFLTAILVAASPASAEVVSANANGFHIRHSVQMVVPTAVSYDAFGRVGSWWDPEHTYSGKAANLSLQLRPGACFCETLPEGGGIEHLRVAYVDPGKRVVLSGSLGPLLYEATAGVMDVRFERIAGGSTVTLDYRVAGFAEGGAQKLAPLVDAVLGTQMRRYREFVRKQPKAR